MKPCVREGVFWWSDSVTHFELYSALYIKAEVMRCVYTTGSSKPRQPNTPKPAPKPISSGVTSGFFSSLFSSFTGVPSRSPTPAINTTPQVSHEEIEAKEAEERKRLRQVNETSVLLSVFAVDVNVTLDERLRRELQRATKKNPPSKLRLELIYVCRISRSRGQYL